MLRPSEQVYTALARPGTFQPGVSGNPGGRPKTKVWTEAIKRAVEKIDQLDPQQRPRLDLLAEALVAAGLAGDTVATKEIGDRLEGKVPQGLVGADGESPAELVITWQTAPKS